jgi:hypothetical protein
MDDGSIMTELARQSDARRRLYLSQVTEGPESDEEEEAELISNGSIEEREHSTSHQSTALQQSTALKQVVRSSIEVGKEPTREAPLPPPQPAAGASTSNGTNIKKPYNPFTSQSFLASRFAAAAFDETVAGAGAGDGTQSVVTPAADGHGPTDLMAHPPAQFRFNPYEYNNPYWSACERGNRNQAKKSKSSRKTKDPSNV